MLLRWEHIPEAERLIASTCYQSLAIWARCEVENTVGVACQCSDLLHRRVAPNIDLVLTIAMCRNELIDILSEHQIADLATGLDRLKVLQLNRVPEFNGTILGASSSG